MHSLFPLERTREKERLAPPYIGGEERNQHTSKRLHQGGRTGHLARRNGQGRRMRASKKRSKDNPKPTSAALVRAT